MGSCFSFGERVGPENVRNFEQFENDYYENRKSERRSCTDVVFLIFMAIFMAILSGLLLYCMVNGNIFRVINGYDSCGNICGKQNQFHQSSIPKNSTCKEQDMRDKGYLLARKLVSVERECVENCSNIAGYRPFLNRCLPAKGERLVEKTFFQTASEDIKICWREIVYLCILALVFSIGIILIFRFFVGIVIWVMLWGVNLACMVATICLWVFYVGSKNKVNDLDADNNSFINSDKTTIFLTFAIILTVVTVIIFLVIIILKSEIKVTVQLFKEAGKCIESIPMLLFEPLLTFVSLVVVVFLFVLFSLYILSSGILTEVTVTELRYQNNSVMEFTWWYNLVAMLWMAWFIVGCQHMVIAGAVSKWYFTRNKSKLGMPIVSSMKNLVSYHLGSVAMGSLIISLFQLLRLLLKMVRAVLRRKFGKCADCALLGCDICMGVFEKIVQYLSRNAYIQVAMHGLTFCKGGKRAFNLLVSNGLRVATINSVGDFVLLMGKVLVVISTGLIGFKMLNNKEGVQQIWVPICLAGMFAFFISHCFLAVYEMCIDTIFLCFCEDSEENDGVTRPYYMSKRLMEYLDKSKQARVVYDKY